MEHTKARRFETASPLIGKALRRNVPRGWRKISIGIEGKIPEARVVEVPTRDAGDAPMLPDLPDQVPPGQTPGSVIADGAHDPRKCHEAWC